MKKRALSLILVLLLCLGLVTPVLAAKKNDTPEIKITWLSVGGTPEYYSRDLNWLSNAGGAVIDLTTNTKIDEWYRSGGSSEGLTKVVKWDADGYGCGFVDKTGGIAIPLEYKDADSFSEGLALVWKMERDADSYSRCGFVDKTGAVVIPMEYDWAYHFSEGLAAVYRRGETDREGLWGFVDKTGEIVVPLEYNRVDCFLEGLARVMKRDADGRERWGFINKAGEIVAPLEYDWVDNFSEGLAIVTKRSVNGGDWCGFIDKSGEVVIPLEDSVDYYNFSEGLAQADEKDANGNWKRGFIDKTGTMVLRLETDPGDLDAYGSFSEGLARVPKEDASGDFKYGFIDQDGAVVVPFEYDDVGDFSEGLAWVAKDDADGNRKYGFINRTGTVVVPIEYDEYSYGWEMGYPDYGQYGLFDNGLCAVRKGASWGVFENPYWTPEDEEQGKFPILPVFLAGAVITVIAASGVLVLVLKKKKAVSMGAQKVNWDANQVTKPVAVPGRCPSCGCQNDPADKFCQGCGKPLNGGGRI